MFIPTSLEPAPANLRRHFLPWDQPWLPQAAAWLARGWNGRGPLDLSRTLALVPTRQSGRRLRQALAEHAAARGAAVFAPRVHTPDTLLAMGAEAPDVASRLESLLAWVELLRTSDLGAWPEVFPTPPPQRDFGWAWRLAESFWRLQTLLTEGGLDFGDVRARAGENFPETARWAQLAELAERQREILAALGRREPHAARREFARAPQPLAGVNRIVLLAAPDPLPLALEVLARWAAILPVEVVVFAPAAESEAFDAWGRPLAAPWSQRELALPELERRTHLCADPSGEAERAAGIVRAYSPEPDGLVALGIADAEALPLLERELTRAGVPAYNPEGRLRRTERLHGLLAALAGVAREPSFEAIASLARCPDFLDALAARLGGGFSAAHFLGDLDRVRAARLPADLGALRRVAAGEVARVLPFLDELLALLRGAAFPENAAAALRLIFAGRRVELASEEGGRAADAAEAWRDTMREISLARALFPDVKPADGWEIALRILGDSRRTEEKPAGALDLQGWLELLWEDAPHLVVVGLNDGLVPDAVVGDAFVPEALRVQLGLKSNAARFARDAYILQAIAACRSSAGFQPAKTRGGRLEAGATSRLDLILAKTSSIGEPLRPSRLLLRCAEAELPARIAFLFRPLAATRASLPWTRAWKLTPPVVAPPPKVSVTGLRGWLACPFRFYLQHVLRMEPIDPAKNELDARDFGTLCHTTLEALAAPEIGDATDERAVRDFLLARFDAVAREFFGEEHALPLVVQLESARQRLARAAVVHARDRAEGWVTERAEWKFALDLGGLTISGKIDRVDRHPGGAWRVLDYKTSDGATPPHRAHLRLARAGDESLPAWRRVRLEQRDYVWTDLQLPLYLRAIAPEAGTHAIAAGYFTLPKAVGETAILQWSELSPALLDSAFACAEGAAAAIRAGEFWPPSENAGAWDAFASLFHQGAAESIAWKGATA